MFNWLHRKTGIDKAMTAVLAVMGFTTLAMSLLNPIMPLYLDSIGIGPVILGTMMSVAMFGMAIGEAGWGYIADRTGFRLAMITGTFFTGLGVLFFILTTNAPAIFVIFFVWGFLRSAVFGPARGYVGTHAPPGKKSTFMAFSAVMLYASGSLGALPSGFLAESFGYHSVFYTSIGISVIGGIIVLVSFRKKSAPQIEIAAGDLPGAAPPQEKFSLFSLTPQCIVTALIFFGVGTTMTFIPLFATQVVEVDVSLVGVLFTAGSLTNLILAVPMGLLADKLGKKTVMIAGLLVSAGALVGISYAENFGMLIAFMILNSIGMVLFSPAALGLLSDSVPAHRQSTAMGFYGGVCENVGILGGSALGGVIWDSLGPQPTFFAGAIACAAGALVCLVLVKAAKKQVSIGR